MQIEELTDEALGLPIEARALLADRLIESLAQNASEIDRLWIKEIERRREEVRSGRSKTIPASEVFEAARKAIAR
jgi:putative addiction module component (TIGR02574 family)